MIRIPITLSPSKPKIIPKCLVMNARSLAKPDTLPALHCELKTQKADICCVSETWLIRAFLLILSVLKAFLFYAKTGLVVKVVEWLYFVEVTGNWSDWTGNFPIILSVYGLKYLPVILYFTSLWFIILLNHNTMLITLLTFWQTHAMIFWFLILTPSLLSVET